MGGAGGWGGVDGGYPVPRGLKPLKPSWCSDGTVPASHICPVFLVSVLTTETIEHCVFIFLCPFLVLSLSPQENVRPRRAGGNLFAPCYVQSTQNCVHTQAVYNTIS